MNMEMTFLVKTIADFLSWEFFTPYIKFVFDRETINEMEEQLKTLKGDLWMKGRKSLDYLKSIREEYERGEDSIFICVPNSKEFFSLLEEMITIYSKRKNRKLQDADHFIRSIWLRMGVEDILNVENFLRKQIVFLKNDSIFPNYLEIKRLSNQEVLAYRIHENDDWFETNQNIVFSIRKNCEDIFDSPKDYDFPAIHFALVKEKERPTCYIYGIQSLHPMKDPEIKESLQSLRKFLRNKYVSSDFIIGISLFLDYLYDQQIQDIVVPTLQIFNYPYHEQLSSSIADSFSGYSEEDQKELDFLYESGDRSDKVLDYIHTKGMVSRFVEKQDIISEHKSERLIYTFLELMRHSRNMDCVRESFVQGENMEFHLKGKAELLKDYETQKKTSF